MQRLSYPTETDLSNEIARNRIVLSFIDSPRKPLGRRPPANATERRKGGKKGSGDVVVAAVIAIARYREMGP